MKELRGSVYRRDGTAVVALATDPARPGRVLQLLGDPRRLDRTVLR